MARVKGRALKGPLGATHHTAIPQIDILNAPTCLACPLPECVLFFQSDAIRRAEIVNAYRALAKVHHPDVGGDVEEFKRLRSAYEAAIGEK